MRALSLLLFTLLTGPAGAQASKAGPADAQVSQAPTGCKEDSSDCQEDCTVEYGSSTRTYDKLGACLQRCKQKYDKCRERHITLQERKKLDMDGPSSAPQVPAEKGERASTEESGSEKKPESSSTSQDAPAEPPVRRGVYRASEAEPAPEPAKPEEPKKSEPAAKAQADKTEEPKKSEPAAKPQADKTKEPTKPEPAATAAGSDPEPLVDVYDDPPPKPVSRDKPRSKPAPTQPMPPPEPKKDISDWDPNGK